MTKWSDDRTSDVRPLWLTLTLLVCACAHPAQQRVVFSEPTVIAAGAQADAALFEQGTRAFGAGELEKAAQAFDQLWQRFPSSENFAPALWNAALSNERLERFAEALQRYIEYIKYKDDPEAQMHAALAEYKLGRFDAAALRLHALSERPGLPPISKASALLQEGVCKVESGARADGELLLRAALEILEQASAQEAIDPTLPAQAEFWLGEAYRGSSRALLLDPAAMDEHTLADALEQKAQFLLSAQGHYLRCIRRGDGEWATAAGFRIGEMYEALHDELLNAPLPRGLSEAQRALYQEELRGRVRNLVQKAIRIYEETIDVAQRTGAKNAFVEKTEQALERMRKLLLDKPAG